jgi:hypothetical protein
LKIASCRWRPPPRMHSFTATTHFKSSRSFVSPCVCCMLCTMRLVPFFCVTLCVLHALQNATESHSAVHATHTRWHKRTGTFEMRSGSERMHTWWRTPSTGRNFQALIIWITVSWKASSNVSISVNNFFSLDFFNFCWVFQKFPFFVSPCISNREYCGRQRQLRAERMINRLADYFLTPRAAIPPHWGYATYSW